MGAVCGCIRRTAKSAEQNSWPQVSRPMRVSNEPAPTVGCEVPAVAHEQMPLLDVVEASSWDNNKRVEEARRARVEWLESLRRNCGNEEEFQTARTQPIWTEVNSSSSCSSSSCTPQGPLLPPDLEHTRTENRLHFMHLVNNEERVIPRSREGSYPGLGGRLCDPKSWKFYVDFGDALKVGQKIGGGGQADIHEAIYDGKPEEWFVLKVFKNEYLLRDLQRTWSKDIGHAFRGVVSIDDGPSRLEYEEIGNYCCIHHGTLLQDGRFVFVLKRCWGDLRKYIDLQIIKDRTHQSPPFPHFRTLQIMKDIAWGMNSLHQKGTIHKDLKAANCLLEEEKYGFPFSKCLVADFESSPGVVGTGFWRAPEILLVLKNRDRDNNPIQEVWTKMADVYSYAMTCYEVLTGCIPFEDRAANDYDGVIGGERPPLPDYVDLGLQELVRRYWHPQPSMRPPFYEIFQDIQHMLRLRHRT